MQRKAIAEPILPPPHL